jgi:ketosteroid isomerase-like protein
MRSNTAISELYEAFLSGDAQRLHDALAPGVTGHVSDGMPCGVGGDHAGPMAFLRDVWGRVDAEYDIAPIPDSIATSDDGRVVVHGWYRGTHRATGRPITAEFVHLLRFDGDRVTELRQITDTVSWLPS